jgi:basic membrane lipoprotein Med (substrate-binding protein (PBP1-ABC) superfamily)
MIRAVLRWRMSKLGRGLRSAGFALLAATACGGGTEPTATDGFRVALLTPGSIRDAGWNQSAYEGLQRIRDELGAQISHQETHSPQDFEVGFRDFAARGSQLVFGHGFEFQDAAAKVGAEFPGAIFITTSGSTIRENVAPIVFELEQATYVLGYVGAKLSRTGRLGAIGGIQIPSVASTFLAFEAGATRAGAEVSVTKTYVGSWEDIGAAREATLAQISAGTDILIHNADAAGRGFFQAVEESPGVYAFGTNRDQNDLAPDSVLASAVLDIPRALLLVAQEVRDGRFAAGAAEALVGQIESGAIEVPRAGF